MVQPKPVSLTQVDESDYDGPFDPQPLVVVGPLPGGGGGGAVESVNGQQGVVVLALSDILTDEPSIAEGIVGLVDNSDSPTTFVLLQAGSVSVQAVSSGRNTSLAPGEVFLSSGTNRGRIDPPASGGQDIVVALPGASGTLALAADVDNIFNTLNERVPAPPSTGTYRLQSVDGVVSWVSA